MKFAHRTVLLALALAAAGCISVGGGSDPVDRRAYDLLAPLAATGNPPPADGPEVLLVEPFSVDPGIDREELVWRRGSVESGAYQDFRWIRPPETGVRAVLAEALRRSGAAAAVVTDPATTTAEYTLRGHVARCDEVDTGTQWLGALEIRVTLTRNRDGEEILRRTYSRQLPAAKRNPTAVVEAIRKGLDEIGAALVVDVRTLLEAQRQEDGN